MPSRRVERLNEQFKRELMELLQRELRDPRVHDVTVTAVDVTPDLYHARVRITSLAQGPDRDLILEGLDAARPFLRGQLGRRLRIRRSPDLDFAWDETLDHARRIEQLLAQVRPATPAADEEGPPDDDSPAAAQAGNDDDDE
jgi:ribosome-binding factor A